MKMVIDNDKIAKPDKFNRYNCKNIEQAWR